MDEQRKAFKLLIPSIILFVVVIFVAIWFGLDVNGRIKKANYKPGDLYGLQFKEWRYDTNGGSVKSRFYNEKHYLYPIYEYKNEDYKNEFFDFELENDYMFLVLKDLHLSVMYIYQKLLKLIIRTIRLWVLRLMPLIKL